MEKKILIITGESSGDIHGAALSSALTAIKPDLHIYGVGGSEMKRAGVHLLQDNKEMGVVGIIEVFSKIRLLLKIFKKLEYEISSGKYSALILIDYPTFNMMLAYVASKNRLPVYYFIAPQIWAWGGRRIKLLMRTITKMFVILPFEKEIYKKAGMDVEFVGHPFIGEVKTTMNKETAIEKFGINKDKKVVGILPGSRNQEIKALLPVMLDAARRIKKEIPAVQFILPLAGTIEFEEVDNKIKQSGLEIKIIKDHTYDAISVSDFLIVASGSVTLEAGILKKPMVIVYIVNKATYFLARHLVSVSKMGIVNIVAGKDIVPELLQKEATPENISFWTLKALKDKKYYNQVKRELSKIEPMLGKKGAAQTTAQSIINHLYDNKV